MAAIGFCSLTGTRMAGEVHSSGADRAAMKSAYLTEKLELTTDESRNFWPVYDQYVKEMKALNEKYRSNFHKEGKDAKEGKEREKLTEKDYQKRIEDKISHDQERLDLEKKYATQFQKVISSEKVVKLYSAEKTFRKHEHIMRGMQHHRGGERDGRDGMQGGDRENEYRGDR